MKKTLALLIAILFVLAFGCKSQSAPATEPPTEPPQATAEPTKAPDPTAEPTEEPAVFSTPEAEDWNAVELLIETDEYGQIYVTAVATVPVGMSFTIELPRQDDYTYENTEEGTKPRKVHMPIEIFLPNEPVETAEFVIAPQMRFTDADGTEYEAVSTPVPYTLPTIEIELKNKPDGEDGVFRAGKNGTLELYGQINVEDAELLLNGTDPITVEADGTFVVTLQADAAYTITAAKANCVTCEVTVRVEP